MLAAAQPAGRGWRARPWAVFLGLVALYLGATLAVRLAVTGTPEQDEAEQLFLSQELSWGYNTHPPLYTWLFRPVWAAFGLSLATLVVFRIAVLGCLYALLFGCARRLMPDARLAGLAALSPLLLPVVAWDCTCFMVHTPLLLAASAATLYALLRLPEGRAGWYVALGLALGVGAMAKYTFPLFAAALLAAALTVPAYRSRLLTPKVLFAVVPALVVALPHYLWLLAHRAEVQAAIAPRGNVGAVASPLQAFGLGVASLAWCSFLFLGPWLAFFGVSFPRALRPSSSRPVSDGERLLARFLVASLLLLLIIIAATGMTRFLRHWPAPFLLFVPLYAFARLGASSAEARGRRRYALAVAVCALAVLAVRGEPLWLGLHSVGQGNRQRDAALAELAGRLREAGFDDGAIVTTGLIEAGYLRLHFPHARIHCLLMPMAMSGGPVGGDCAVVWEADHTELPYPQQHQYLAARLGVTVPDGTTPRYVRPSRPVPGRRVRAFGYYVLDRAPAGVALK